MTATEQQWKLKTRTDLKLSVRAARSGDEAILDDLFHHIRHEELRFRFLSAMKHVSRERIREMIDVDHHSRESFIAFLDGSETPVGVGTLAIQPDGKRSEVAISVHAEYRNRGIGWELLAFIADQARSRGVTLIQSIESRANHDAIKLEQDMGFSAAPFPGDATLVLVSKVL